MRLPASPHEHPQSFEHRFATGDLDTVLEAYEPGAVFVPRPGEPVTGPELTRATRAFLDLGLPLRLRPRHTYVAGDVALLIIDWSMRGTSAAGTAVDLSGTAVDVLRRGGDGAWRYVIDLPFGPA